MKRKAFFLVVLLLQIASTVFSQQKSFTQYLYWIRYQNQLIFNKNVQWTNEVDNRRFFHPDVANQFIAHSRVNIKSNRWDFGGGITYSVAFASKPENGYKHGVSEIRPVVEASYEFPFHKFFIQNRIRLDNRFFETDPDKSVFEESYYVLRYRYRLQGRVPLKKDETEITILSLKFGEEIMLNSKKNLFDQNRVYITGELFLSTRFSAELGYVFIHQQRAGQEEFFNRHVIRGALLHRINL